MVHARLRLGYHYPWEFAGAVDENKKKCKVCYESNCHTLYHYVMECPLLNEYRDRNLFSLEDQARYLIENNKISIILKRYRGFASPR